MTQRILLIAVVTCYCGGVTGPAVAELVTLSSGNSVARIDTGSALGLYSWTVDGVEHLSAQQLWFRVGDIEENPISSTEPVGFTTDGQSATVQFAQGLFDVDLSYALVGGALGSGQSQLAHIITLTNVADEPLDLHLFQYVDLDVDGEFDFNSLSFLTNDLARQIGPSGSIATVAVSDLLSRGGLLPGAARCAERFEPDDALRLYRPARGRSDVRVPVGFDSRRGRGGLADA